MFDPRLPKSWGKRFLAFGAAALVGVLGLWWWLGSAPAPDANGNGGAPAPREGKPAASRHWRAASGETTEALAPVRSPDAVRGKVVDAVSGAPISAADVTLRAGDGSVLDEAATGLDGTFSFPRAAGETVAAEASGYAMTASVIPVGSAATRIVLALDGAVIVRGKVVDAAARGIAGAEVWVEDEEGAGYVSAPAPSGTTNTAADGSFVVSDAPAGRLRVFATHPAHARASVLVGMAGPGRTKDGVVVTLADGATVTGRVSNPDGSPAAGALVALYLSRDEEDGGFGSSQSRTDAGPDGSYRLEHVRPGSGFVAAATTDAEASQPVTLADGSEQRVDITLGAGVEIAGRVEDDTGAPLAGVALRLFSVGLSNEKAATASRVRGELRRRDGATSGPDGRFQLRGLLPPGPYMIDASTPSGARARVEAEAGETDVKIVIARGGAISGEVMRADGSAADVGGVVVAESEGKDDDEGGDRLVRDLASGTFELRGVAPGDYQLTVRAAGYGELPSQPVHVAAGATTGVRFTLPARGLVRGRLVGSGGSPVRGARVSIAQRRGRPMAGETDNGLDWASAQRSGPDGRFELPVLPGEHSLFVYHPDYQPVLVPVTLAETGDTDVGTIELHAGEGASAVFEFSGIGAVIASDDDGRYLVRSVLRNSPAENAGLRKNDQVLAVDGVTTQGQSMQDVILRIRGPVGTTVSLDILRPGNTEPFRLDIIRQQIKA